MRTYINLYNIYRSDKEPQNLDNYVEKKKKNNFILGKYISINFEKNESINLYVWTYFNTVFIANRRS